MVKERHCGILWEVIADLLNPSPLSFPLDPPSSNSRLIFSGFHFLFSPVLFHKMPSFVWFVMQTLNVVVSPAVQAHGSVREQTVGGERKPFLQGMAGKRRVKIVPNNCCSLHVPSESLLCALMSNKLLVVTPPRESKLGATVPYKRV